MHMHFSLYLLGRRNSTTCVCLPSTTWLPGMLAKMKCNRGDPAIGNCRRHSEQPWGVNGGDPLSTLTPCHSSTKVTPGGGDHGERSPFLCLPHCLAAHSLLLSSYLAIHPFTSCQQPLSFFMSFVALPPFHSLFASFILPGI